MRSRNRIRKPLANCVSGARSQPTPCRAFLNAHLKIRNCSYISICQNKLGKLQTSTIRAHLRMMRTASAMIAFARSNGHTPRKLPVGTSLPTATSRFYAHQALIFYHRMINFAIGLLRSIRRFLFKFSQINCMFFTKTHFSSVNLTISKAFLCVKCFYLRFFYKFQAKKQVNDLLFGYFLSFASEQQATKAPCR